MNISISRDGQQYGPYSSEEFMEHWASGQFNQETDYVWCEGMADWLPLKEAVSQLIIPTSPVPPPPPVTSSDRTIAEKEVARPKSFLHRAFSSIPTHQANPLPKASSKPEDGETGKKTKRNGYIGCLGLIGFTLFVLILVGGGSHGTSAVKMDGDTLLADANSDYVSNDSLYNHIMGDVWSLARSNPAAKKLTLTVHIKAKDTYGKDMQQDVPIQINDLDEVRKFADITTYEYSYHRSEIAGELMSGGFRGDSQ